MESIVLKQFNEIVKNDLSEYPIWVSCHGIDQDEKWYDDTNEETFRPWLGARPVDPGHGMYLVKAKFHLKDGTTYDGFITPVPENMKCGDDILGLIQPYIFINENTTTAFWFGMLKPTEETIARFYLSLRKTKSEVFPIKYQCDEDLSSGIMSGIIPGFCYIENRHMVHVI